MTPELAGWIEAVLADDHTGTFTTLRPDGSPHVAPVRFSWDPGSGLARVLTVVTSRKARNLLAAPGGRVALCQVMGFRWVTLEGTGTVTDDPVRLGEGVERYAARYRQLPPEPPGRVVVEVAVDRVLSLG